MELVRHVKEKLILWSAFFLNSSFYLIK